jgi:hypothetical protein
MGEAPAPEAAEARRRAAALGDRANELAAAGRVAEVPALWEEAIAGLEDAALRDRITLAYAWYQALHGEAGHGVRLAAGLQESPVDSVRGQIRVLVRNRWRVEPETVEPAWHAATGCPLPAWVHLDEDTVRAVADWVSARDWQGSQNLYAGRIAPLTSDDALTALDELLLAGGNGMRPTVELHRAILALGGPVAYPCLTDADRATALAATAVTDRDWDVLRAVGTLEVLAHRRRYLGAVHVVAAEAMAAGGAPVDARIAARLAHLAGAAPLSERVHAAAGLRAIGDEAVAGLRIIEA